MMLTRRVRGRTLLLKPSPRTNQIVQYVVAVMALRWNIAVHALIVMGNHWHACLTDPDGAIVDFQRDTHHFIAKGINAHYHEHENLWVPNGTSRVECEEPADLLGEIAYTMANPVEAGLVRHGHQWPGVRSAWPAAPITIKKPPAYFCGATEGGDWPDEVVLELSRPPGFDSLTDEALAVVIKDAVDEREQRFRDERDAAGKTFMGRQRVLQQSRHSQPRGAVPHFGLSPKFACRNQALRKERIARDKRWSDDYYSALPKWRAGDRNVEFPAGTYQLRVVHNVRVSSGPD